MTPRRLVLAAMVLFGLGSVPLGCTDGDDDLGDHVVGDSVAPADGAGEIAGASDVADAGGGDGLGELSVDMVGDGAGSSVPPFVAVTFNTGTSLPPPDGEDNGGFHSEQSAICDEWYGNGLSWVPFVEATAAFFAEVDPDVVVFQEIFWSGECPDIPSEAKEGFVCETWQPGDPTVAQLLLQGDWQVMCNPGKPDKCAAVNRRFGTFAGCDDELCLEGMEGYPTEGCGKGARIGRATIELVGGGTVTLVNVHGSSGFSADDMACRTAQFQQVFEDLGDGEPGANGEVNLIMGDFNTDPVRMTASDESAAYVAGHVGDGTPFHFVNDVSPVAPPTYAGVLTIDLVISDVLVGECWSPGVTQGHGPVMDAVAFDHTPAVCAMALSEE